MLIPIGFGGAVNLSRIVAINTPESAPARRLIDDAREAGRLIDATGGRQRRTVIFLDSGHLILSALQPDTLLRRLNLHGKRDGC